MDRGLASRRPRGPGALAAVARLVLVAVILWTGTAGATTCAPGAADPDPGVTLVFSGGGAKGAYEAGVASALVSRGVPIRLVAGSSAGALNAAMVADGRVDRLETMWRTLTREQVYALRPSVAFAGLLPGWLTLYTLDRAGSLFDPRPLRELVATTLDLDRVRRSPVRLLVVAADVERRAQRVFDNANVSVEALMAASAVPGAFPPVDVDGELLIDGGLTGRAPVLEALAADPAVGRAIVILNYATTGERGARPTTMRRVLEEAFEMAMIHQIRRDAELARFRHPLVRVILLAPSAPLAMRPLDFDAGAMARALELGRADALACFGAMTGTAPR